MMTRTPLLLTLALLTAACSDEGNSNTTADTSTTTETSTADTAGETQSGGDGSSLDFSDPTTVAPDLTPSLLVLTRVGGAGDQFIEDIAFDDAGEAVIASGAGFSVSYPLAGGPGALEGDIDTPGEEPQRRPDLPGSPGRLYSDPRVGLDFTVGYRQAGNVQLPIFRAFENDERIWALWGHAVADVEAQSLMADSRCYQAWGMPDGMIGVQCWTDGGNSVLTKDPRDLTSAGFDPTWAEAGWQRSAGGMSSLYAVVDPRDGGRVVSGTFVAAHVARLAVDAWGRVVVAQLGSSRNGGHEATDPFDQGEGEAGFFMLDSALEQPLQHIRLGGGGCADGVERFSTIALRDNILVLGGTTCAATLNGVNTLQDTPGGGQDALLAILQLW